MNEFNYEEQLEKIKSALFDIYEEEEHRISMMEEAEKEEEQKKYRALKDNAASLLQEIKNLYIKSDKEENTSIDTNVNKEASALEEKVEESVPEDIEEDNMDEEEISDHNNLVELEESIEDKTQQPARYYIDDRNGNVPNFAYIPERLLNKLMNGGNIEANKLYKQDDLEKKGIIVRADQFMKLSLSKKRQEGILREAKQYRVDLATKSREQLEQIGGENESD